MDNAFALFDNNNHNQNNNEMKAFRELKKLLRIVEIFLILVFATWVTKILPFVVRIFGEYLRQLLNLVVNPLFIFLVANLIALTLFYKSKNQIISHRNEIQTVGLDFMDVDHGYFDEHEMVAPISKSEVVYQDKETILEEVTNINKSKAVANNDVNSKICKRSHSENFSRKVKCVDEEKKKLRRSETEIKKRDETTEMEVEVVDEMSNEEFQRAIEDFIARQIKFHKEEKLAIVVHDNSTNVVAN